MTYRPDIDGLRAIAVLAVMLFHFGLVGLSGGYVGVDIFFVISGYLIGGIIVDETANGSFSYVRFYARRIKRLFAAFLVVGLAATLVGWWLLLPGDLRAFGKSVIASAAYAPNVLFYRDIGYFDSDASTKPLLHTWSLGVEEQFYICFPLLMRLVSGKHAARTLVWLILAALVSFACAQYLLHADPAASFYWLPARAWELTLGTLVALPAARQATVDSRLVRPITLVALAAVLVPLVAYTEATPFPGLAALPPSVGTAWLLWVGHRDGRGWVQAWLRSTPMVAVGRISYSLYLWHWPVYVYLAYYYSGAIPWPARLLSGGVVFGLAALSWRYVEQPARYSRRPPAMVFGAAAAGSAVLIAAGFALYRSNGAPGRLAPETREIAAAADDFIQSGGRCFDEHNSALPGLAHCQIGARDRPPQFLIWGDSHARAIWDGADQAARENDLPGLLVWSGGCLPAFDLQKHESASGPVADKACTAQNAALKSSLAKLPSIRSVMLVGRWAYYTEGRGIGIDAHNRIRVEPLDVDGAAGAAAGDQARIVAAALRSTVAWLHGAGYKVSLLEQVPEIPQFTGRKLFQTVRSGRDSVAGAIAGFGTVERAQVEARQRAATLALQEAAGTGAATILPTHSLFCRGAVCSAWAYSRPAYFDNNHLTVTTSREIRSSLLPGMTP